MESSNSNPAQVAAEVQKQAKGLLGSLTDFSFENFVTPKIIKLIYILLLAGACIWAIFVFFGGVLALTKSVGAGLLAMFVIAPLGLILGAVFARVYVEIIMLAFKILETLQRIEAKQK